MEDPTSNHHKQPEPVHPPSEIEETAIALAILDPDEVKKHFQTLQSLKSHPFEFELHLINTARDWQISLEECRRLWEQYSHSTKSISQSMEFWEKGILGGVKRMGGIIIFLSQFSLLFGVLLFVSEADKRQREARNQAWQVINSIKPAEITASAGRIEALDSLNRGCAEENSPPWKLSPKMWQEWRKISFIRGFYAECVNLTGLNLRGAQLATIQLPWSQLEQVNLENATLDQANLQFADLQSANLIRSRLHQTNLNGANLTNAHLSKALLIGARLRNANLFKADLSLADLIGVDLRGANLINADLYGTNLKRAIYDQQTQPFEKLQDYLQNAGAYFIDTKEKTRANLIQANLSGVDLSATNLREANLTGANLRNTVLKNAQLENAILTKANLRGANFTDASLNSDTNFTHSLYDDAMAENFPPNWRSLLAQGNAYKIEPQQNLSGADLRGADLQNANLSHSILKKATLAKADLRGTNFSGADLTQANVKGALYDVTTKIPSQFTVLFEQTAYNLDYNANLAGADLAGLTLKNANLVMSNLIKANLDKTDLQGSNLFGANLSQATLQQAVIKQVNLMNANLTEAQLQGANLTETSLVGANLEQANLDQTILKDADLTGASLQGAKGLSLGGIKEARNWQRAKFDPDFLQQLEDRPNTTSP